MNFSNSSWDYTTRPNRVQTKINLIYSLHQMRFSKFPRDGAGSARCQLDFLISTFDSSVRCGAGGAGGDQTDPISRNVTAISLSPSLPPLRTGSRPGVVSQIGWRQGSAQSPPSDWIKLKIQIPLLAVAGWGRYCWCESDILTLISSDQFWRFLTERNKQTSPPAPCLELVRKKNFLISKYLNISSSTLQLSILSVVSSKNNKHFSGLIISVLSETLQQQKLRYYVIFNYCE